MARAMGLIASLGLVSVACGSSEPGMAGGAAADVSGWSVYSTLEDGLEAVIPAGGDFQQLLVLDFVNPVRSETDAEAEAATTLTVDWLKANRTGQVNALDMRFIEERQEEAKNLAAQRTQGAPDSAISMTPLTAGGGAATDTMEWREDARDLQIQTVVHGTSVKVYDTVHHLWLANLNDEVSRAMSTYTGNEHQSLVAEIRKATRGQWLLATPLEVVDQLAASESAPSANPGTATMSEPGTVTRGTMDMGGMAEIGVADMGSGGGAAQGSTDPGWLAALELVVSAVQQNAGATRSWTPDRQAVLAERAGGLSSSSLSSLSSEAGGSGWILTGSMARGSGKMQIELVSFPDGERIALPQGSLSWDHTAVRFADGEALAEEALSESQKSDANADRVQDLAAEALSRNPRALMAYFAEGMLHASRGNFPKALQIASEYASEAEVEGSGQHRARAAYIEASVRFAQDQDNDLARAQHNLPANKAAEPFRVNLLTAGQARFPAQLSIRAVDLREETINAILGSRGVDDSAIRDARRQMLAFAALDLLNTTQFEQLLELSFQLEQLGVGRGGADTNLTELALALGRGVALMEAGSRIWLLELANETRSRINSADDNSFAGIDFRNFYSDFIVDDLQEAGTEIFTADELASGSPYAPPTILLRVEFQRFLGQFYWLMEQFGDATAAYAEALAQARRLPEGEIRSWAVSFLEAELAELRANWTPEE